MRNLKTGKALQGETGTDLDSSKWEKTYLMACECDTSLKSTRTCHLIASKSCEAELHGAAQLHRQQPWF